MILRKSIHNLLLNSDLKHYISSPSTPNFVNEPSTLESDQKHDAKQLYATEAPGFPALIPQTPCFSAFISGHRQSTSDTGVACGNEFSSRKQKPAFSLVLLAVATLSAG